ncbi:MAG TPA: Na+/H+ antiporter subunit E, partial [Euzebyales bacterium]|nr:Na+/H+ antiporter subunit E [Euzebyales bacterium]
RRVPTLVGLVLMWIALWGTLSLANLLTGAAVALAVMLFAHQIQPRPVQHLQPAAALQYLRTFAKQLIVANWQVIKAVLRPHEIQPGILAVPLHHASDAVVTLVANSITLTPGTLTLETDRRGDVAILYVHALDLTDADGVREDIGELEVLAVDAFAGPQAQVVQARTLSELEEGEAPTSAEPSSHDGAVTGTSNDGEEPQ